MLLLPSVALESRRGAQPAGEITIRGWSRRETAIGMHRGSMDTLPPPLPNLSGQNTARWGLMMACSTVIILPIVLLFLLVLQGRSIAGVTVSGVKG